MMYQEVIQMLEERRVIGISSVNELDVLVEKYPYCSSFQVLKAIALKEADHLGAKEQLNKAAVYIPHRENLYDYLVKGRLLDTLAKSELESPAEELAESPSIQETNKPELQDTTQSERDQHAQLIPTSPLEEEILREAVVQMGEKEVGHFVEEISEQEEIDAPAEKEASPSSFASWLLNIDKQKEKDKKSEVDQDLIDKFIQESPQISPVKTAFFSPSQMGKMSLVEDESFVTETLAKIYERQGDFKKAAKAYHNLMLKYPEKSVYFANLQKQAEEKSK